MPALCASQTIAEPFKVGTFEIDGAPTVGIVLRNSLIVEFDAANRALQRDSAYPEIPLPADMLELISRYDYGLKRRLYELVNYLVAGDMLGEDRPDYIHDVGDVRTLPPIMYPGKILNAAVNFYSHVQEAGTEEERREGRRLRREQRGVPYLFIKPSRGAVVGNGDDIVIPHGRNRTDWEVELGTVIGKTAKYVSANDAEDHVFGYMVTLDGRLVARRLPATGSSVRVTTPSHRKARGSCRRNSTATRWRFSGKR
jgi:2-keto-4-pentenoate hydratase/2-oxohepta-3-ene-1,7-dioic acid hydratase in catechol pathway